MESRRRMRRKRMSLRNRVNQDYCWPNENMIQRQTEQRRKKKNNKSHAFTDRSHLCHKNHHSYQFASDISKSSHVHRVVCVLGVLCMLFAGIRMESRGGFEICLTTLIRRASSEERKKKKTIIIKTTTW